MRTALLLLLLASPALASEPLTSAECEALGFDTAGEEQGTLQSAWIDGDEAVGKDEETGCHYVD